MLRLRFRLPPPERGHPAWGVLSVLIHAVVLVLFIVFTGERFVRRTVDIMWLQPPAGGPTTREATLPAYALGETRGTEGTGGREGRTDSLVVELPLNLAVTPDAAKLPLGPTGVGGDSVGGEGPIGTGRILGPAYGDGRLWVRTHEAAMGIVGPAESAELHVAQVDSALRDKIKAFIDTMPRDSFALPPPPVWTTEVAGRTWGMDDSWIYLGDLKLPTALLALLPWPQGNYDQAKRAAELEQMRQDIVQAARRAETAADFREYVEEVRKRRDAERELERGAVARDTIKP